MYLYIYIYISKLVLEANVKCYVVLLSKSLPRIHVFVRVNESNTKLEAFYFAVVSELSNDFMSDFIIE